MASSGDFFFTTDWNMEKYHDWHYSFRSSSLFKDFLEFYLYDIIENNFL